MAKFSALLCLCLATFLSNAPEIFADKKTDQLRFHKLFSDHMVIQRNKPIPVHGWDKPDTTIMVKFGDVEKKAISDKAGKWQVVFKDRKASGPFSLSATGTQTVTYKDIMIGDVFLCSGQSNMEWSLKRGGGKIPTATNPRVRFYTRGATRHLLPQEDIQRRGWDIAGPDTAADCYSIPWHFAHELVKHQDVTIGLINSARGSTNVEEWIPMSKYHLISDYYYSEVKKRTTPDAINAYNAWWAGDEKEPGREHIKRMRSAWPMLCFNGQIAPLKGLPLAGILWYQGEHNAGTFGSPGPTHYPQKFATMITAWRQHFDNPSLPFIFAQLPSKGKANRAWRQIQAYQREVSLSLPNTGMVVAYDSGGELHPGDSHKQQVALGMANHARRIIYREKIKTDGPCPTYARRQGQTIIVSFDNIQNGLIDYNGGTLIGFTIGHTSLGRKRRPSGKTWPVSATIKDNAVHIHIPSDITEDIHHVGYNVTGNADCIDLQNSAGLQASAFQIDIENISTNIWSRGICEAKYVDGDLHLKATLKVGQPGVAMVKFYNGLEVIGMDNNGSDGWSMAWKNAPTGLHAISAEVIPTKQVSNFFATMTPPIQVSIKP